MIDPSFVPMNPILYKQQKKWVYNVLRGCLVLSTAKSILIKYKDTFDILKFWKEFVDQYMSSMMTDTYSRQLAMYLMSSQYHTSNWRGSQESWLLHYKEQKRLHTQVSVVPFLDEQYAMFLKNAVAGTPNLATVDVQEKTTHSPTKTTGQITFDEYHTLRCQQAQIHDAANKVKKPSVKTSVNQTEFIFDDGMSEEGLIPTEYEVEEHDIDMDVTVLMATQGPSKDYF